MIFFRSRRKLTNCPNGKGTEIFSVQDNKRVTEIGFFYFQSVIASMSSSPTKSSNLFRKKRVKVMLLSIILAAVLNKETEPEQDSYF